ncbi:MAG: hypothetical protein RLP02_34125, partial [Coleofasciculus sp. C2-GNP5-27]
SPLKRCEPRRYPLPLIEYCWFNGSSTVTQCLTKPIAKMVVMRIKKGNYVSVFSVIPSGQEMLDSQLIS